MDAIHYTSPISYDHSVDGKFTQVHSLTANQLNYSCVQAGFYFSILVFVIIIIIIIIIRFFYLHAAIGVISTSVGPLPGNWLAAHMAHLTPDLQVSLS